MTELRMTPKRLELLQAIADGRVEYLSLIGSYEVRLDCGPEAKRRYRRIDAHFQTLQIAGLAKYPRLPLGTYRGLCELTPSGESVLASHREGS